MIVRSSAPLASEEMGYVAWQESGFDPLADERRQRRGDVAVHGLSRPRVRLARRRARGVDDRTDVSRAPAGAARYLANLLAEFGEDSFMLAIASYNKGENGCGACPRDRAAAGRVSQGQARFWHLTA